MAFHRRPLPARKPRPRWKCRPACARSRTGGTQIIYKTSFDKANRSSISTARGLGLSASLDIFNEIRETSGLPVITDVHLPEQCAEVAQAVDVLQIPAFLSRQTDLLVAAAQQASRST